MTQNTKNRENTFVKRDLRQVQDITSPTHCVKASLLEKGVVTDTGACKIGYR